MDRFEVGDIVRRSSDYRNNQKYQVLGVNESDVDVTQLWLRPVDKATALTYNADRFEKVAPFFEEGETYDRKSAIARALTSAHEGDRNRFHCLRVDTNSYGIGAAYGRYYRDAGEDKFVLEMLHDFNGWEKV